LLVCMLVVLLGFVGVCCHVFLGLVGVRGQSSHGLYWCLWLCFPRLLMFMVVLSWALLVFLVVALMGCFGVPNHWFQRLYWYSWSFLSWALLMFLIVVLMGFIGVPSHYSHGLYQHLWSCSPCFFLLLFMLQDHGS
jgi:hypothetical protein